MKKYKDYLIATILFIITIIISYNFIKGFNSYDTYKMYQFGYLEYAKQLFFADGRIFSGFYILTANILNIFQTDLYEISIILCIIIMIANVVYFKRLILKISNKKLNDYLIFLLAFITIFNFTYVDNMRFIEMPIIAGSIFLYIIAAKQAVIDKNNIKMLISLLIAIFMYQGTINVFFIMTAFLLFAKYQTINRKVMLEIIKTLFLSMIPIIINFLYIKIYGILCIDTQRAMTDFNALPSKFINCLETLMNVFVYSKSTMPKNFHFFMILINIILIFLLLLKYKEKNIFHTYIIIALLVIFAFISCLPITLFFTIEDIDSSYMAGRLFWAVGAIYGLMMIILYLNTDILQNRVCRITYVGLILIYAIILYLGMNGIMKADVRANEIDRNICYQIKENIEAYEQNSNYKVEKLKIKVEVSFEGISKEYEKAKTTQSYIISSLPIGNLLEFYSGLKLDTQYIPEKVKDFKENIDFYYVENTAYLYMNY